MNFCQVDDIVYWVLLSLVKESLESFYVYTETCGTVEKKYTPIPQYEITTVLQIQRLNNAQTVILFH